MKFAMKVEEEKSIKTRDMIFCDLENGEVFMNEDKELYIRTPLYCNEFEYWNAVKLDNGELVWFDEGNKVWAYEGEVVFNPNAFNNKVVIE